MRYIIQTLLLLKEKWESQAKKKKKSDSVENIFHEKLYEFSIITKQSFNKYVATLLHINI